MSGLTSEASAAPGARLRERTSARLCYLRAEHLVGRAAEAALVLEHPFVSTRHALLRWRDEAWEVRDLGSRNGTRVDGAAIATTGQRLRAGAVLEFGHPDTAWVLESDAPPAVMAVPLGGGAPILAQGDLLPLPSPDDPQVTLYRDLTGLWRRDASDPGPGGIDLVADGQIIDAGAETFRFLCGGSVTETLSADEDATQALRLELDVSRDEEHVALTAVLRGGRRELGARAHNYLLLTLARQRLRDRADGVAEASCGWIYQDELLRALHTSPQQVHLDVFRIRKQLGDLGLAAAASIIERRPRTRQLRIGCADLVVRTS